MSTVPDKPHVHIKEDGLRNVDVYQNFQTLEEITEYIEDCQLIGVGTNAVVFLLPPEPESLESENLFRFEIRNPMGYEWTKKILESLIQEYPSYYRSLSVLLEKLETLVKPHKQSHVNDDARKHTKAQVAAHNAAFRRDPSTTMPINSVYTFQNKIFGTRIRYLNGTSLGEGFPGAELTQYAHTILDEPNPKNVITGITNSQFPDQLIDLTKFIPSDQEISEESGDLLAQENDQPYTTRLFRLRKTRK